MTRINVLYCGTHNCGIFRSATTFSAMARNLGHEVIPYPTEGLNKRKNTGMEQGDLTVLMLPPILMGDAYEYGGVTFNPDITHKAYWYWETDTVPEDWLECVNKFKIKEIWAPNKFVLDACTKRGLNAKVVFPHVQPPKIIRKPSIDLPSNVYTFLYIFDFASAWQRKNPIALLKAFAQAFKKDDNVQLIMKTVRSFVVPGILNFLKTMAEKDNLPVMFIDGDMPFSEVHGLQQYADCYVSPHRGEGLGLTLIDAAYLGKPIIATGFGGNVDFTLKPLLIDYDLVEIPEDVPAYGGQGLWADPKIDHLASLMRWVYENQESAKTIGLEQKKLVEEIFNEIMLTKKLADVLV